MKTTQDKLQSCLKALLSTQFQNKTLQAHINASTSKEGIELANTVKAANERKSMDKVYTALSALLLAKVDGHALLDKLSFSTTGRALRNACVVSLADYEYETGRGKYWQGIKDHLPLHLP